MGASDNNTNNRDRVPWWAKRYYNKYTFTAVYVVLVAGILYTSVPPVIEYYDSADWKKTECTILRSEVRRNRRNYIPHVVFRYVYDDTVHVSEHLTFFSWRMRSSDRASKMADRYEKGMKTECLVNPDQPDRAVLMRKMDYFPFAALIVIVVFSVPLIVAAWYVQRVYPSAFRR